MNNQRLLLRALMLFLLAGTAWAWANTMQSFVKFYGYEGTILKFTDCVIPNPLTEACFYGAVGFLIALIWALALYARARHANVITSVHNLWLFLSAGTIFAFYNVTREFVAFYTSPKTAIGCSAVPITNPFLTPCFTGAVLFFLSAIISGMMYHRTKP